MTAKLHDIIIERKIFYDLKSGYYVAQTDEGPKVVIPGAIMPFVGPVTVMGEYKRGSAKYGSELQLEATKVFFKNPEDAINVLVANGFLTGIKKNKAQAVISTLGVRIFEVLDKCIEEKLEDQFIEWNGQRVHSHSLLQKVKGIGPVVVNQIMDSYRGKKHKLGYSIVAVQAGLTMSQFQSALSSVGGQKMVELIMSSPYKLTTIEGFDWETVDIIAQLSWAGKTPIPHDDPGRLAAAVRHIIDQHKQRGHMAMDVNMCLQQANQLATPSVSLWEAIQPNLTEEGLVTIKVGEQNMITTKLVYEMENETAQKIAQIIKTPSVFLSPLNVNIQDFSKLELAEAQIDAVRMALVENLSLIIGGPGCLSGDTIININRGANGTKIRIDDLVKMFNGGTRSGKTWDETIPTYVARNENGLVRLGVIKNAWFSGRKQTYKVKTTNGREIRATSIHPFLTVDGWKTLGKLVPGDFVYVNLGKSSSGRKKMKYKYRDTKFHPYQRRKISSSNSKRWDVLEHRLAYEAKMNGMDLQVFINILRTDKEKSLTLKFLSEDTIVHHIDKNILNNNPSNLEAYSKKEHATLHSTENTKNVLDVIGLEKIESIEKYGTEPTYDIEVEDDPHNFIANGFVVHNTGKSTITNVILDILDKFDLTYTLCAPTGKAALRITEITERRASTLHKEFELFDKENVLECRTDYLLIDEFSMVSADILRDILKSVVPGKTKVIFIGDSDQLPPVGPGEPLLQLMNTKNVPFIKLTSIFRQAKNSSIITAAHAVNSGKDPVDEGRDDFRIYNVNNQVALMDILKQKAAHYAKLGYPQEEVAILTPVNKGAFGRSELNKQMQHFYNEAGVKIENTFFKLGDKVIQTKNDYQIDVMNGQIGTIVDILETKAEETGIFSEDDDEPIFSVLFEGKDTPTKITEAMAKRLQMAYALTVHKTQGSQYKVVLFIVPPVYQEFYLRQLVYTGITRASEVAIVLNVGNSLHKYVINEKKLRRISLLSEMLEFYLEEEKI